MDAGGQVKVVWSEGHGTAPRAAGSAVATPAGILQANTSVIMAETTYAYDSLISSMINAPINMEDVFYLRPRRSDEVTGP